MRLARVSVFAGVLFGTPSGLQVAAILDPESGQKDNWMSYVINRVCGTDFPSPSPESNTRTLQ